MSVASAAQSATSSSGTFAAAVLGATGAVGSQVLKVICSRPQQWSRVVLVSRREIPSEALPVHDGVEIVQLTTDMNDEAELQELASAELSGVDAVFITMGVGASSKATPQTLERVDVTLPTAFATGARQAGAKYAALLTSVGADSAANADSLLGKLLGTTAGSPLYAKLKGTVEENLKNLGFDAFSAFRPATLIGEAFIVVGSCLLSSC